VRDLLIIDMSRDAPARVLCYTFESDHHSQQVLELAERTADSVHTVDGTPIKRRVPPAIKWCTPGQHHFDRHAYDHMLFTHESRGVYTELFVCAEHMLMTVPRAVEEDGDG
jgi:hypothetical protein